MMSGSGASFSTTDYVVFTASLVISMAIGMYHGVKGNKQGTRAYLMGGSRLPILPIFLSLFAGIVSASGILGNSSEIFYRGSQLWMCIVGMLVGTVGVCFIIVPVLHPLKLVSMYEYFEVRFGDTKLQKLTTVLKLFHFLASLGISLYGPSLALASIAPVPINASVVVLGVVCALYSAVGGAKAVVYTDTFQAFVMFAGVIAVIIQGLYEVGGPTNSWNINKQRGRIDFFNLSTDPLERYTLLWVLIMGTFVPFSMYGSAQPQYQRWGSVSTLKDSIKVILMSEMLVVSFWSLCNYAGLVVFSVYADCDPLTAGHITKPDQVLAYFVVDKLSYLPGMPGIFVASVYCAVLSSVSSKINGITAMIWRDLLRPLPYFANTTEEKAKRILICISLLIGLCSVLFGLLAGGLRGLVQATYTVGGALVGPVVSLFLTSILCPWITKQGALLGALTGLSVSLWITLGHYVYGHETPFLQLSTDGCNETTTFINTTNTNITATPPTPESNDVFPLYQVTYCLYGTIGASTTFFMSTIFSALLGFADPNTVPENAVNKTCLQLYRRLRGTRASQLIRGASVPSQQRSITAEVNDSEVKELCINTLT